MCHGIICGTTKGRLSRIVSKDCSRIAFKAGITDVIIDDDKMQNRSILSSHLGWVRSKGLCSFGPVKNMIGAHLLGIFCSSTIGIVSDSGMTKTKRLLWRLCGADCGAEEES